MATSSRTSLPLRVLVKFGLNVGLTWLLASYLNQYFVLSGDWKALVVIGALLTLMNMLIRPVLSVIMLPLKLFAAAFAIIIINGFFVWLIVKIAERMDAGIVTLSIEGGLWGWIVVAVILGLGNWMMKAMLK